MRGQQASNMFNTKCAMIPWGSAGARNSEVCSTKQREPILSKIRTLSQDGCERMFETATKSHNSLLTCLDDWHLGALYTDAEMGA